jgi:hypothetical protein
MAETQVDSDSEEGLTREEIQQVEDEPPAKRAKQDACTSSFMSLSLSPILHSSHQFMSSNNPLLKRKEEEN